MGLTGRKIKNILPSTTASRPSPVLLWSGIKTHVEFSGREGSGVHGREEVLLGEEDAEN